MESDIIHFMTCTTIISAFHSFLNAAENFRQNFAKRKSRSPRGFLPRPLLRAGESITPPPFPQKNSGGVLVAFTALLLCRSSVLRTEARSARWTLGILLEKSSSKVYNYSTYDYPANAQGTAQPAPTARPAGRAHPTGARVSSPPSGADIIYAYTPRSSVRRSGRGRPQYVLSRIW